MASPQGVIEYGRLQGFTSASFTLSHGTTPSIAAIYVPPNPNIVIPPVGDLTISMGGERLVFPECLFQRQTVQTSDSGEIQWGIEVKDVRWKWQQDCISGFYNVTIGERVKELKKGTEKTPQELLTLCFEAVQVPAKMLDVSAVPNESRPEIAWEWTRVTAAIDDLCRILGCRVVLLPGNRVSVVPAGKGARLPLLPYVNYSRELEPPFIPDTIKFVGARTLREVDIPLMAVAKDVDGRIKPLSKVSYTPPHGWGKSDVTFFGDLNTKGPRAQKAAEESVFRWFRPIIPFKIPAAGKLPAVEIIDLDQILPLLDHQVSLQTSSDAATAEEGAKVFINASEKPAEVWGVFYDQTAGLSTDVVLGLNGEVLEEKVPVPPKPGYNLEKWPRLKLTGFQIDRERGLVITDSQCFDYSTSMADRTRFEPFLFLRCAVQYRDAKDPNSELAMVNRRNRRNQRAQRKEIAVGGWMHGVYEERLRRLPLGTGAHVIQRTDIGQRSRMTWMALKEAASHEDNNEEWEKRAKYYIEAAKSQIKPDDSSTATYVGLKAIQPDGAIQQVTWAVGEDGFAFTRVSRNREESLIVPSFEQRQMINQIRMEIERQQKKTGQPKK